MSFNEIISKYYPNFSFKYKWAEENYNMIFNYLKIIMINSFNSGDDELRGKLPELIHYVEDFFYSGIKKGFFVKNGKFNDDLVRRMLGRVQSLGYLPNDYARRVYGHHKNGTAMIRRKSIPYFEYEGLNNDEVRRLFLFHELGHALFGIVNHDAVGKFYNTYEQMMASKGMPDKNTNVPKLLGSGFVMIEECLCQELAEELAFDSASKKRPPYRVKEDLGCMVENNYVYYGLFQQPVIDFGRTLKGCGGSKANGSKILANMLKRALRHDFVPDVISEYNQKGSAAAYQALKNIIINMGYICHKKYESFGETLIPGDNDSFPIKDCLDMIHHLSSEYIDNGDYPLNGFPEMDFTVTVDNRNTNSSNQHNNNDRYIPGTSIPKPREMLPGESEKEYSAFLKGYYNQFFPAQSSSSSKKDDIKWL